MIIFNHTLSLPIHPTHTHTLSLSLSLPFLSSFAQNRSPTLLSRPKLSLESSPNRFPLFSRPKAGTISRRSRCLMKKKILERKRKVLKFKIVAATNKQNKKCSYFRGKMVTLLQKKIISFSFLSLVALILLTNVFITIWIITAVGFTMVKCIFYWHL